MRAFLMEHGYSGEVIVAGYGESRLRPRLRHRTSSEEHYRLARRVAFP